MTAPRADPDVGEPPETAAGSSPDRAGAPEPTGPGSHLIGLAGLTVVVLIALLAAAVAWSPASGSPAHDGGEHTSELARTADRLGYDVHASLLGADTVPAADPSKTLYIIQAGRDADGGLSPDRATGLAHNGARVLLLDKGQAADVLSDHGWSLQNTPIYSADLREDDATTVDLTWPVGDMRHRVQGTQPFPLAPATPQGTPEGEPILTSNRTFADLDGNRELNEADVRGPFTVGVDLALEDGGRLIYLTTPYPLTNAAAEHPDAEPFREALLFNLLPEGGSVLFDTSSAPRPAGVDATHQVARAGAWMATCLPCSAGIAAVATGLGAYLVTTRDAVRKGWTSHATDLDHVAYPDTETETPDHKSPQHDTPEEAAA